MKFHDGYKRINKLDGGKKSSKRLYHKALRNAGKKMSIKFSYTSDSEGGRKGKEYEGEAGIIESQLDLLLAYKERDSKTKEGPSEGLLDDIKIYEFILASEDPEGNAKKFLTTRWPDKFERYISKREAVEILGWKI